jgi:hypothetical protein
MKDIEFTTLIQISTFYPKVGSFISLLNHGGVFLFPVLAIDGFADAELREEYYPHNDVVGRAVNAGMKVALDAG